MFWVQLAIIAYGAYKGYQAGKEREALAHEQSLLADRNMVLAKKELNEEVRRQSAEDKRLLGIARARAAASGAELSGTPLSYLNYMESEQGRELDWLKTSGASRIRLEHEGDLLRAKAGVLEGKTQQSEALYKGASSAASIYGSSGAFS